MRLALLAPLVFILLNYTTLREASMAQKPQQQPWNVWKLRRQDWRNIKINFILSLISTEAVAELYVRVPQSFVYSSEPRAITDRNGAESVVLIFPGAGGVDSHITDLQRSIERSDREEKKQKRYVRIYDWSEWRNDFVRIAFDGQATGKAVCSALAEDELRSGKPIRNLHAIGVSVGSFAADSCIKAYSDVHSNQPTFFDTTAASLSPAAATAITETTATGAVTNPASTIIKNAATSNAAKAFTINAANAATTEITTATDAAKDKRPARTRLTTLDPFTSKGIFGYGWGNRNFGKQADLAINYYNTDDVVPTTKDPLNFAYNYDVTVSAAKATFVPSPTESLHSWPVAFLASNWNRAHRCYTVEARPEGKPLLQQPTTTRAIEKDVYQENGLPQDLRARGDICTVK